MEAPEAVYASSSNGHHAWPQLVSRVAWDAAHRKGCPSTKLHWKKKAGKQISALCIENIQADVGCWFSDF